MPQKKPIRRPSSEPTTGGVLGLTNVNLVGFALTCLAILWIVAYKQPTGCGIWNLFLIAMGGSASGAMIGFMYASFGKERDDLKPIFAAANGLLGGAAITDLARGPNSLIRGFIWSLAKACGFSDGIAIIAMVILSFWTLGFLALYYNRKLLLNTVSAAADDHLQSITAKDDAGNRLRNFWKPQGIVNKENQSRIQRWMNANGAAKVSKPFSSGARNSRKTPRRQ